MRARLTVLWRLFRSNRVENLRCERHLSVRHALAPKTSRLRLQYTRTPLESQIFAESLCCPRDHNLNPRTVDLASPRSGSSPPANPNPLRTTLVRGDDASLWQISCHSH